MDEASCAINKEFLDDRYVSQTQCEQRRNKLLEENEKTQEDTLKLYGEVKALAVSVNNNIYLNRWMMGIVAVGFSAMFIYLLTH